MGDDYEALLAGAAGETRPPPPPQKDEEAGSKRRGRWNEGEGEGNKNENGGERRRRKKSRWGAEDDKIAVPSGVAFIPQGLNQMEVDALLLRARVDEIDKIVASGAYVHLANHHYNSKDRSPSPPPIYDRMGQRMNTRDQRYKEKLEREKNDLCEKAMKTNPYFKPPSGFKLAKKTKKVYIPVKEHPGYNFIGLIIGPRGNTQKKMEKETGAKISIRGKGSAKAGKELTGDDANDELHVLLTADTEEQLIHAEKLVKPLLDVREDHENEHKQLQLRELASLNGTLRSDEACRICGELDHRQWSCPKRTGEAWRPADVACRICGENSHPTVDCPKKQELGKATEGNQKIDTEYESFMAELEGRAPPKAAAPEAEAPKQPVVLGAGAPPPPGMMGPPAGATILGAGAPPPPGGYMPYGGYGGAPQQWGGYGQQWGASQWGQQQWQQPPAGPPPTNGAAPPPPPSDSAPPPPPK